MWWNHHPSCPVHTLSHNHPWVLQPRSQWNPSCWPLPPTSAMTTQLAREWINWSSRLCLSALLRTHHQVVSYTGLSVSGTMAHTYAHESGPSPIPYIIFFILSFTSLVLETVLMVWNASSWKHEVVLQCCFHFHLLYHKVIWALNVHHMML